jgi:hypothetical protein
MDELSLDIRDNKLGPRMSINIGSVEIIKNRQSY